MIDLDTGKSCHVEVYSARRNKKIVKIEKFIGRGWYEYAKKKRLRRGDKLWFNISYLPIQVYVSVLNR